jgi:hypothetical protein
MSFISMLYSVKHIFPTPLNNDVVNAMPRRELTREEASKPYAKYHSKDMTPIPQADLDRVNAGPIDASKALPILERNRLLQDGDLPCETGYCLMPDGTGFAATRVLMENVSPAMLDWWFNWHPLEGLRYTIWCPIAHSDISAETPQAHLDSSGVDLALRNYGKSHFPVEGFDLKGALKLRIHFRTPQDMGLDIQLFHEPNTTNLFAATVTHEQGPLVFPINIFMHCVRRVERGVEYRSRYWLGWVMDRHGKIVRSKFPIPKSIMVDLARCNCIHSLIEYNHLASILPDLYAEQQGKITGFE